MVDYGILTRFRSRIVQRGKHCQGHRPEQCFLTCESCVQDGALTADDGTTPGAHLERGAIAPYDPGMNLVRPDQLPARTEFALPHGLAISGILEFEAGTRVPLEGVSRHDEDEISFILTGSLKAVSGDQEAELRTGDISFIPAQEEHWALVLEDTRIAYVLVSRAK